MCFRYAAGATIQILLFGILAIEVKRKAPTAHTVLEIISKSNLPLSCIKTADAAVLAAGLVSLLPAGTGKPGMSRQSCVNLNIF